MLGTLHAAGAWLLILATRPAAAHPFNASFTGHQVEVALQDGHVDVAYVAEVPTREALLELKEFLAGVEHPGPEHQAAFTERTLAELASGLRLQADGAPVALSRVPVAQDSGVGDARFIVFRLRLQGELPPGARTLHLVNTNRMGGPALFSDQVWVDDGVVLDALDLVQVEEGRVRKDASGRWLGEEELREVRLSFHRRPAWLARLHRGRRAALDPEAPDLLPARAALVGLPHRPLADAVAAAGPWAGLLGVGLAEGAAGAGGAWGGPLVLGVAAGAAGGALLGAVGAGGAALGAALGLAWAGDAAPPLLVPALGLLLAAAGGALALRRTRGAAGLLGLAAGLAPAPLLVAVVSAGLAGAPARGLGAGGAMALGHALAVGLGGAAGVGLGRLLPGQRRGIALVAGILGGLLGLWAARGT